MHRIGSAITASSFAGQGSNASATGRALSIASLGEPCRPQAIRPPCAAGRRRSYNARRRRTEYGAAPAGGRPGAIKKTVTRRGTETTRARRAERQRRLAADPRVPTADGSRCPRHPAQPRVLRASTPRLPDRQESRSASNCPQIRSPAGTSPLLRRQRRSRFSLLATADVEQSSRRAVPIVRGQVQPRRCSTDSCSQFRCVRSAQPAASPAC